MLRILLISGCLLSLIFCESLNDESQENFGDSICEKSRDGENVAFIRLGKYRGFDNGSEYQKNYFLPRYLKATWAEAKTVCKAFNLELVSLETITEALHFLSLCDKNSRMNSDERVWYLIDGMVKIPKSKTEWFWTNSGKKVSYTIPWHGHQPDCYRDNEFCLTIGRGRDNSTNYLGFNDYPCSSAATSFICQKVDFYLN